MAHISLVLYATSGDIKIVSFGAAFCYHYIYRHILSFLISLSWLLLGGGGWSSFYGMAVCLFGVRDGKQHIYIKGLWWGTL